MKSVEKKFIKIIQQNGRVIYKVCSFYVSEEFPMEDLYQEVVHNLWIGFPKFRNESNISTWIYRIAINTCISSIRRESKLPKSNVPISSLSDWTITPVDLTDEVRELYRMINKLKTLDKTIILLWLEEKSYKEIAEITGISLSNVGTRLKRAKEKLRKMSTS